jgi:hypothetical protein
MFKIVDLSTGEVLATLSADEFPAWMREHNKILVGFLPDRTYLVE